MHKPLESRLAQISISHPSYPRRKEIRAERTGVPQTCSPARGTTPSLNFYGITWCTEWTGPS